jgi:hypothetical protein
MVKTWPVALLTLRRPAPPAPPVLAAPLTGEQAFYNTSREKSASFELLSHATTALIGALRLPFSLFHSIKDIPEVVVILARMLLAL